MAARKFASLPEDCPVIQAADSTRPSIADLPLEIQLIIMEMIFDQPQIVIVDVSVARTGGGSAHEFALTPRPPPLQVLANSICRFTRVLYRTQWHRDRFPFSCPLPSSTESRPGVITCYPYWVDLGRDVTFLRILDPRSFAAQWHTRQLDASIANIQGGSASCPFEKALAGVGRIAVDGSGDFAAWQRIRDTIEHFISWVTGGQCERIIFQPVMGLESPPNPSRTGILVGGPLQLGAVQVPLEPGDDRYVIFADPASPWGNIKQLLVDARRLMSPRQLRNFEH